MATVEEVVAKYIELRDRKAVRAKEQAEELRPLSEAMEQLEAWLLAKMNTDGCDSFKTKAGTPYKVTTTSVKLEDPEQFKRYIFTPAVDTIVTTLLAMGYDLRKDTTDMLAKIILLNTPWDMVDFRAGKKGIVDAIENGAAPPPGTAINRFTAVNVRR